MSVKTDAVIVKEVLTNLISNAIKYTPPKGEVTVLIRSRLHDVLISVTDTGWGIPKFAQDQIFSKFFRGDNVVKRETTGTGLGLYLVKGLLDEIGGKVWFTSEEGEGTSFSFALPRKQQPAKRARETTKANRTS
jgi:signal transduction histidine kinase